MKFGDRTPELDNLHSFLIGLGFLEKRELFYGIDTVHAVQALQEYLGLDPTGEFDDSIYAIYEVKQFNDMMSMSTFNLSNTNNDIMPIDDKDYIGGALSGYSNPGITTASSLNVRKGSGTNYSVISQIPKGTVVQIIETAPNGWHHIKTSSGVDGWVSGKYVTLNGSTTTTTTTNTVTENGVTTTNTTTTNTTTDNNSDTTSEDLSQNTTDNAKKQQKFNESDADLSGLNFPCYIQNLLTGTTIKIPVMIEEITWSKGNNYDEIDTKGRSASYMGYAHSTSKTLEFSFTIHSDMLISGDTLFTYCNKLEALAYPRYGSYTVPPKAFFRCGDIRLEGVINEVSVTLKPPIINEVYSVADISISMTETYDEGMSATTIEAGEK